MSMCRREKNGAVHYAAKVTPGGAVTLWGPESMALDLDDAAVAAVKAHYAGRPGSGRLTFHPAGGGPAPAPAAKPAPVPAAKPAKGASDAPGG